MGSVKGEFEEIGCELVNWIEVAWYMPYGKSLQTW
jgi:hypothetical protein